MSVLDLFAWLVMVILVVSAVAVFCILIGKVLLRQIAILNYGSSLWVAFKSK